MVVFLWSKIYKIWAFWQKSFYHRFQHREGWKSLKSILRCKSGLGIILPLPVIRPEIKASEKWKFLRHKSGCNSSSLSWSLVIIVVSIPPQAALRVFCDVSSLFTCYTIWWAEICWWKWKKNIKKESRNLDTIKNLEGSSCTAVFLTVSTYRDM